MSKFANIKPGQYFVTDASEVERAVRHFKGEELLAVLTSIHPKYGETAYQYSTNLVADLDTVSYPRILGLQFDRLGHVEIVFSFGLTDTIDLTANFTQRGYT